MTRKLQRSKGSWEYHRQVTPGVEDRFYISVGNIFMTWRTDYAGAEGDVALIAAAPSLLNAAKTMLRAARDKKDDPAIVKACEALQAAIKNATEAQDDAS